MPGPKFLLSWPIGLMLDTTILRSIGYPFRQPHNISFLLVWLVAVTGLMTAIVISLHWVFSFIFRDLVSSIALLLMENKASLQSINDFKFPRTSYDNRLWLSVQWTNKANTVGAHLATLEMTMKISPYLFVCNLWACSLPDGSITHLERCSVQCSTLMLMIIINGKLLTH